jgi:hypothetical protein
MGTTSAEDSTTLKGLVCAKKMNAAVRTDYIMDYIMDQTST